MIECRKSEDRDKSDRRQNLYDLLTVFFLALWTCIDAALQKPRVLLDQVQSDHEYRD
jgi:hypothetical protein